MVPYQDQDIHFPSLVHLPWHHSAANSKSELLRHRSTSLLLTSGVAQIQTPSLQQLLGAPPLASPFIPHVPYTHDLCLGGQLTQVPRGLCPAVHADFRGPVL
jgi:hypothetical protein